MKDKFNFLIRFVYFMGHAFLAMVRSARGGLFCWRNSPTWVVRDFVELDRDAFDDSLLRRLHDQARDELVLRDSKG